MPSSNAPGTSLAIGCGFWDAYHSALEPLEERGLLRRPMVPAEARHNGHIYYVLYPDEAALDAALHHVRAAGIDAIRHYVPLHSSPAGLKYGRASGTLPVTDAVAGRLMRLPLWIGMAPDDIDAVVKAVWAASTAAAA